MSNIYNPDHPGGLLWRDNPFQDSSPNFNDQSHKVYIKLRSTKSKLSPIVWEKNWRASTKPNQTALVNLKREFRDLPEFREKFRDCPKKT